MRKSTLFIICAVSLLTNFSIVEARDYDHHGGGHGNALVAGLIGLGLGVAIAAPPYRPEIMVIDNDDRRYWRHHDRSDWRDDNYHYRFHDYDRHNYRRHDNWDD